MCLQNGILHQAEQDVMCYKFVISNGNGWKFPYRGLDFPGIGTTVSSRRPDGFQSKAILKVSHGIHSCASLKSIFEAISPGVLWDVNKQGARDSYAKFKIILCKIPKGSFYYAGEWRGLLGYSSERLEYVSEVFDSSDITNEKFVQLVNLIYGTSVNS